jgi:hypothetical protein
MTSFANRIRKPVVPIYHNPLPHPLASTLLVDTTATETFYRPQSSCINSVIVNQISFGFTPEDICPETSARYYHYSLRNNPEQRSSHS